MRWDGKEKNNGWKTSFAFFPVKIGDTWVWLEPYASRFEGLYTNVRFYEGCGERVGYPCGCYRHRRNTLLQE